MRRRKPYGDARRQQRPKLHDEVVGHQQGAGGEDDVAYDPQPLPPLHGLVEFGASRIGEPVLEHRGKLSPTDRVEVQGDPKHKSAVV